MGRRKEYWLHIGAIHETEISKLSGLEVVVPYGGR